jgi:hypothetical protein
METFGVSGRNCCKDVMHVGCHGVDALHRIILWILSLAQGVRQ